MKLYVEILTLMAAVLVSIADSDQPLESPASIDINEGLSPSLQETSQSDYSHLKRVVKRQAGKPKNVPDTTECPLSLDDLMGIPEMAGVVEAFHRICQMYNDLSEIRNLTLNELSLDIDKYRNGSNKLLLYLIHEKQRGVFKMSDRIFEVLFAVHERAKKVGYSDPGVKNVLQNSAKSLVSHIPFEPKNKNEDDLRRIPEMAGIISERNRVTRLLSEIQKTIDINRINNANSQRVKSLDERREHITNRLRLIHEFLHLIREEMAVIGFNHPDVKRHMQFVFRLLSEIGDETSMTSTPTPSSTRQQRKKRRKQGRYGG